jgi:hypothetical protein
MPLIDDVSLVGHEHLAGEQTPFVESPHQALDLRAAVRG